MEFHGPAGDVSAGTMTSAHFTLHAHAAITHRTGSLHTELLVTIGTVSRPFTASNTGMVSLTSTIREEMKVLQEHPALAVQGARLTGTRGQGARLTGTRMLQCAVIVGECLHDSKQGLCVHPRIYLQKLPQVTIFNYDSCTKDLRTLFATAKKKITYATLLN